MQAFRVVLFTLLLLPIALAAPPKSPPPKATMSPDGSILLPTDIGHSLVTIDGTWTFGTATDGQGGTMVLLNGVNNPPGYYGKQLTVAGGGRMYLMGTSGRWYIWQNGTWVVTSAPTMPPSGGGGGGTCPAGQFVTSTNPFTCAPGTPGTPGPAGAPGKDGKDGAPGPQGSSAIGGTMGDPTGTPCTDLQDSLFRPVGTTLEIWTCHPANVWSRKVLP